MKLPSRYRQTFDNLDRRIGQWMETYGHAAHRYGLALLFIWFGLLKQMGYKTTTSLLAHTVYFGSPQVMVSILGWWEVAIGVCLLWRRLIRVALLLLFVRVHGTLLAFILKSDVCFIDGNILAPTPEGQYLVKDVVILTAAMVIGGAVRRERAVRVFH